MTAATHRAAVDHDLYFEIKARARRAVKSDEYANLAGEPGHALDELLEALVAATEFVRELVTHDHQWGENDYCSTCGADGRA